MASDWPRLLHLRSMRRAEQNTELRRHDRLEKSNLSLDHKSGCSPGGRPSLREDLRVPIQRLHQRVSKSNTCTWAEGHCSVTVPPFWGVTGQSGTTPHHAGGQKTEKVEVRQQHCPIRKIWKTGTDPVRSQQKSTNLLRSHRLSCRGAYLWETQSRGRFSTLSDSGRLFLNLSSNDRVGRAAQRLGVRAAFWNLRYGERYDVTHPVNLRRLFRDIADGGILGCMMSVPSTGWSVARCCSRPLCSSAQPWGIEKSRVSVSLSDLACFDTGNHIMRTVIKIAWQCQRFNVLWAIENPEKTLCWVTSQLQELSKLRNVYKKTFDFCAFGTKRRTHVEPPAVADANDAVLQVTNTCNSWVTTLLINVQCSRSDRSRTYPMKLTSRLANLLLGPTLTARMQRTCYDLGMQRERRHALLCRVFFAQSLICGIRGLLCFPVAETLPWRDETQFPEKVRAQSVVFFWF